jgi:hypothetical protein
MPSHCGPGKYAIAVSLKLSSSQEKPPYLQKRGFKDSAVYDFTFDYDYSPVTKRSNSDILMRLDYSDNDGYWKAIVGKSFNANLSQRNVINQFNRQSTRPCQKETGDRI